MTTQGPADLSWTTTQHPVTGRNRQEATYGQYRYLVTPAGFLSVSMRLGDTALYEAQMRGAANARAYAAEIARGGGPA